MTDQFPERGDSQQVVFAGGRKRGNVEKNMVLFNRITICYDDGTFNPLAQFIRIQRPVMVDQKIYGSFGKTGYVFGKLLIEMMKKVFSDNWNVFLPIPERL
jgi:hypothetical protein